MRIICPSCHTAYAIPDGKIGPSGREVRCARCGERWHAVPEPDEETAAAETVEPALSARRDVDVDAEADAAAAVPLDETFDDDDVTADEMFHSASTEDAEDADGSDELEDAGLIDDGGPIDAAGASPAAARTYAEADAADDGPERPVEGSAAVADKGIELAARPKIRVAKKKQFLIMPRLKRLWWNVKSALSRSRKAIGIAIFVAALCLPPLAFFMRQPLVTALPQLAGFFRMIGYPVNLRGVDFGKVETLREMENGQPVLVVEGMITNPSSKMRLVPAIRLALRGADGQEIYAWSIEPKVTSVAPGDEVRFRSRLAAPPEDAVDVQLRFAERKTRQAANP